MSTGGRRLVMLTKANLAANAKSIAESLRMDCTERSAVLMPVSYSYGLSVVNSTIYAGGRLLIPETDIFHKECWDYLEENRVTAISGVPYAYEWYRKLHVFDRTFEALRLMTTAGGAMSRSMKEYLLQEAERRNVDLAVMYGQTEATARISSFFLNEHPDKIDSVGTVMTADGEREMIGIFGTKEPDAAWERRVLQRYPILRGSVKYIQIEELPRTMNGKLDYKKLQEYI